MAENFSFSPLPPNENLVESITTSKEGCHDFTFGSYTSQLAELYTRRALPPGYATFMKILPKASNGDWEDLALKNPISLFLMGTGLVVPIIGLFYWVLLYRGHMGSPRSSERPFQRYWRYIMYIIMVLFIIYSLVPLYIASVAIGTVLSTGSVHEGLPSMDDFIKGASDQIDHIFQTNTAEILKIGKAEITAYVMDMNKQCREKELPTRPDPSTIDIYYGKVNKYYDGRMNFTDEIFTSMMFFRDMHRVWMRMAVDRYHSPNTFSKKKEFFSEVAFADRLVDFLNPRMVFDYEEALSHMHNLTIIGKDRIKEYNQTYEDRLNSAFDAITHFGEIADLALTNHFKTMAQEGEMIKNTLSNILERQVGSGDGKGAKRYLPRSILWVAAVVCLTIYIILISFMLGLVVGILGFRGPRDSFGFNKLTASKLLTGVASFSCPVYTAFAFSAAFLYFYSLVVEKGYCNMDAV